MELATESGLSQNLPTYFLFHSKPRCFEWEPICFIVVVFRHQSNVAITLTLRAQ